MLWFVLLFACLTAKAESPSVTLKVAKGGSPKGRIVDINKEGVTLDQGRRFSFRDLTAIHFAHGPKTPTTGIQVSTKGGSQVVAVSVVADRRRATLVTGVGTFVFYLGLLSELRFPPFVETAKNLGPLTYRLDRVYLRGENSAVEKKEGRMLSIAKDAVKLHIKGRDHSFPTKQVQLVRIKKFAGKSLPKAVGKIRDVANNRWSFASLTLKPDTLSVATTDLTQIELPFDKIVAIEF